jgi:alpha/beta superfamily hydrolase
MLEFINDMMFLAWLNAVADIIASFAIIAFSFSALVVLLLWRSKAVHDQNVKKGGSRL